jgi:serine/threonine protein kinase
MKIIKGQLPFETEQEILEYNLQMKAPVSDEYKELLNDCLKVDPSQRPSLNKLLEYSWCVNNLKEAQHFYDNNNIKTNLTSTSSTTKTVSNTINININNNHINKVGHVTNTTTTTTSLLSPLVEYSSSMTS